MKMVFARPLQGALLLLAVLAAAPARAQMDMGGMKMPGMQMTDPLGVSMDRFGSGTTWLPEAVSLPTLRTMAGPWQLMAHGFAFLQEDAQGGPRGGSQLGSLNWGMFMASRELGGGRLQFRTMLSLDAATVTPRGYPLLLQTGESFHGEPVHDRQHPHDFFMELGAMYERPVTKTLGVFAHVAPSGEPALGPVAFMHRPSAMDIPSAPIGHHWQDATHISFGVLTAGVFASHWKLETSAFNGRDPDDNRWNLEQHHFDSYSARVTVNPSANWSVNAGYGFIAGSATPQPEEAQHRLTASAMHGTRLGANGQVATTLVWGANKQFGKAFAHSLLAESEAVLDDASSVFGRAEWVQKTAAELVVPRVTSNLAERFDVAELSLGYVREIARWGSGTIGLGAMATLNVVPLSLEETYGSRTPPAGMIFLRLRPRR